MAKIAAEPNEGRSALSIQPRKKNSKAKNCTK
jgi:hypothetical protein